VFKNIRYYLFLNTILDEQSNVVSQNSEEVLNAPVRRTFLKSAELFNERMGLQTEQQIFKILLHELRSML
jgi:hypothetical protein